MPTILNRHEIKCCGMTYKALPMGSVGEHRDKASSKITEKVGLTNDYTLRHNKVKAVIK